MNTEINSYLRHICDSYSNWGDKLSTSAGDRNIRAHMTKEFTESLLFKEGSKYIKVITGPQRSVHSFIVKEDGPKFKRGDILKAASWATPALNFKRGNVLTGDYKNVTWTGA